MKFHNKAAEIFIPSVADEQKALSQTTHLCIAAHHVDLEIMAYGPIAECYGSSDKHFSGVVVTDGGGSPRSGVFADYTDEDMKIIRAGEQKQAASIGRYSAQVLLAYPSGGVKDPNNSILVEELKNIILACSPDVLYTHNLADKHDTHIGVVLQVIRALKEVSSDKRPKKIIAMEVWRALDWLCDGDKVMLDTGAYPNVSAALVGVFDSQISGGKRYDLAIKGRWLANATFFDSHSVDSFEYASLGMDITDLINSDTDPAQFISLYIDRFKSDVMERIAKFS